MEMLVHIHSGLRWLLLLVLVITIFKSMSGWMGKRAYTSGDRKLALFTVIFAHTQLIIGLIQYFVGKYYVATTSTNEMDISVNRFFRMEHIAMMIMAIAFITIGSSSAKRASSPEKKHKRIFAWFLTALMLILAAMPWPFMAKFATLKWF